MRNIGALIIVLIIGFAIGSFTNTGSNLFSFLRIGDSNKNITDSDNSNLIAGVEDLLNKIKQSAQKETGVVFDKQYLDAMIVSYESSVALSKIGTVAGGHNEIRTIAKNVSKDDAIVLAQLKKWRAEWYPENTQTPTTAKEPPFVKK